MILPDMVAASAASLMLTKDCLNGLTVVSLD
jgi:hypothetical protein